MFTSIQEAETYLRSIDAPTFTVVRAADASRHEILGLPTQPTGEKIRRMRILAAGFRLDPTPQTVEVMAGDVVEGIDRDRVVLRSAPTRNPEGRLMLQDLFVEDLPLESSLEIRRRHSLTDDTGRAVKLLEVAEDAAAGQSTVIFRAAGGNLGGMLPAGSVVGSVLVLAADAVAVAGRLEGELSAPLAASLTTGETFALDTGDLTLEVTWTMSSTGRDDGDEDLGTDRELLALVPKFPGAVLPRVGDRARLLRPGLNPLTATVARLEHGPGIVSIALGATP